MVDHGKGSRVRLGQNSTKYRLDVVGPHGVLSEVHIIPGSFLTYTYFDYQIV